MNRITERTLLWLWLAAITACGIAITLARPVVESDSLGIWFPKVRALLAGTPLESWAVPEYPPLGSVLWALPLLVLGPGAEAFGRIVYTLAYVAWVMSLTRLSPAANAAGGEGGRRWAFVTIGAMGLAMLDQGAVTSGYQDTLLMSMAGMSGAFLATDLMGLGGGRVWPGLVIAGALGLVKNEGTIYGAILVVSWFAFSMTRRHRPSTWFAIGGYVVLASAWPTFMRFHGISKVAIWVPDAISISALIENRDRLPVIVERIAMLRPTYWLPVAAAACLSIAAARDLPGLRRALAWLWVIAVMHLGFIVGVFMLTGAPLDWHLTTALPRLAAQHTWIWATIVVVTLPRLLTSATASTSA